MVLSCKEMEDFSIVCIVTDSDSLTAVNSLHKEQQLQSTDDCKIVLDETFVQCFSRKDLITNLNLEGCQLACLPDFISLLPLKKLNLSDNNFETIPEVLCNNLGNLKVLDLSYNYIYDPDPVLKCLLSLKSFNIRNNCILNIPRWFLKGLCPNLLEINLSFNPLNHINDLNIFLNGMKIQEAILNNCTLSEKDGDVLCALKYLRVLDISNILPLENGFQNLENRLWDVPFDRLEAKHTLTKLYCSSLGISILNENIANLINLVHIDFSKNDLDWIPDSLIKLEKLEVCNFSCNKICVIPSQIGELPNLREVYLAENCLYSLPDSLYFSTSLTLLDVYSNELGPEVQKFSLQRNIVFIDFEQNHFLPNENNKIYLEKRDKYRMLSDKGRINGAKHECTPVNSSDESECSIITNGTEKESSVCSIKAVTDKEEVWSDGSDSEDKNFDSTTRLQFKREMKPVQSIEIDEKYFEDALDDTSAFIFNKFY